MGLFEYGFVTSLSDTLLLAGETFLWGCALVAGALIVINWISERD